MVLSNPKNSNVFYGWPLWKATSKIWNGYLISLVLLKDGHFWLVAKVLIRFEWENWNSNLESYLICRKVYHCIWQEYAVLWCCSSCWITTTTDSIPISFNFLMVKFVLGFLLVFESFLESISKNFLAYLYQSSNNLLLGAK